MSCAGMVLGFSSTICATAAMQSTGRGMPDHEFEVRAARLSWQRRFLTLLLEQLPLYQLSIMVHTLPLLKMSS